MDIRTFSLTIACLAAFPFLSPVQSQKGQEVKKDSVSVPTTSKRKPYDQVILKNGITRHGMLTVHIVDDKYYFQLPDSIFNVDILSVNRIAKAASENRSTTGDFGYAGDLINSRVIKFERGLNKKIFIRAIEYSSKTSDTSANGLFKSFANSNVQPIIAAFDIATTDPTNNEEVIDVTDFLNSDNPYLFLDALKKGSLNLNSIQPDKSFIQDILSFAGNVEIKATKTYNRAPGINFTYELNSSLIRLPGKQMHTRAYDSRIGNFFYLVRDYDNDPQNVKDLTNVLKWNLQVKPSDLQDYRAGKLVEPVKPIVFYIDPATPKKWLPFLIQGVNDWQKAFEKAGFKNAIYARQAPTYTEDPDWSIEDARHSVITYKTAFFENASGMCITDPRSGEILLAQVNWYHNVIKLLHDWYFVQTAAVDPNARKAELSDSLMGSLIRYVCAHEIGHTLGLAHNFAASATVPTDSLRSKDYVDKNGICPSIMDYARFNYVAQPEDNISAKGMISHIGAYDEWAIDWTYRVHPEFSSEKEENTYLSNWVTDVLKRNPTLRFGSQGAKEDPRCQSEDLGDNSIKASTYGIKNLQRILPHIVEWLQAPEEKKSQGDVSDMYDQIFKQYQRYIGHVVRHIGGVEFHPLNWSEEGNSLVFTNRRDQKEAVNFLSKELFTTPQWLIDEKWTSLLTGVGPMAIMQYQEQILYTLLSQDKMNIYIQHTSNLKDQAYPISELLTDLQNYIFTEVVEHKPIDLYRRNLQRAYITQLVSLLDMPANFGSLSYIPYKNANTDILADVKWNLKKLLRTLNTSINYSQNKSTLPYLTDMKERIEEALNNKKKKEESN